MKNKYGLTEEQLDQAVRDYSLIDVNTQDFRTENESVLTAVLSLLYKFKSLQAEVAFEEWYRQSSKDTKKECPYCLKKYNEI